MNERMLLLLFTIVMNSLFIVFPLHAQSNVAEEVVEDIFEDLSVNSNVENVNWEDELESLIAYRHDPLDLNTATREELEQFPFLSDYQVEQLLAYAYLHHGFSGLYELQLVQGMTRETIDLLLPFVCVRPQAEAPFRLKEKLKSIGRYGRHELITRFDFPLYEREGYHDTYLGPALYNSLRYAFRHGDDFYVGMAAEKDAGEPFAALHNRAGYDYYSFYLFLQRFGRLKALALGNYRLSFGQGLVVSHDFMAGKSLYASSYTARSRGIRKHSSTDEWNYFRGAAATVALSPHWDVSGFYSHRDMDGTVKNGVLTSIYKTGLHRSRSEAGKRHAFTLQSTGGNVSYQQDVIKLGVTGIYYFFDRIYTPKLTGYSTYNLHGRRFYNVGTDYALRLGRLSLQGETAKGTRGWATLNRLYYSFGEDHSLMLLQRFYSYDYWALFARSFAEGSGVQNEQGYYAGINLHPFARWRFAASLDWFLFPWKRYRISTTGSHGLDAALQVTYEPRKEVSAYVRYRFKKKDAFYLSFLLLCLAAVAAGGMADAYYFEFEPALYLETGPLFYLGLGAFFALCISPVLLDAAEAVKWRILMSKI